MAREQATAGPGGEDVGGVARGFHDVLVAAQEIVPMPQVCPVIVHHVAQEPVEEIEAALGRRVRLQGPRRIKFPLHESNIDGGDLRQLTQGACDPTPSQSLP
jgi:hypothetical protein